MPNSFAFFALIAYPIVAVFFFKIFRLPVAAATTIIAGYLLLPTRAVFDLPLLPALDKHLIPSLIVVICTIFIGFNQKIRPHSFNQRSRNSGDIAALNTWIPRDGVVIFLLLAFLICSLLSGLTNRDPISLLGKVIKGNTVYDIFSNTLNSFVAIVPLLIGRKLFSTKDNQKILLGLLAFSGALYACLALLEVRISPQLNYTMYGFFSHDWIQHWRTGGWRPILFLDHGLWVAVFQAMAFVAALGAYRCGAPPFARYIWLMFALWILFVLSVSNSLGGFLLALFALPILLFFRPAIQILVAAVISLIFLIYPAMRALDFIPLELISSLASVVDPSKAESLNFRFENEELFLNHSAEKPWFGWSYWGRNIPPSIYGTGSAVPDGYWVIVLSTGGWTRYLSEFGLIFYGIVRSGAKRKSLQIGAEGSALILVLAVNLIDMVPNATSTTITWLIVGSVLGRLEGGVSKGQTKLRENVEPIRAVRHRKHATPPSAAAVKTSSQSINPNKSENYYSLKPSTRADSVDYKAEAEKLQSKTGAFFTRFDQNHRRERKQLTKPDSVKGK